MKKLVVLLIIGYIPFYIIDQGRVDVFEIVVGMLGFASMFYLVWLLFKIDEKQRHL